MASAGLKLAGVATAADRLGGRARYRSMGRTLGRGGTAVGTGGRLRRRPSGSPLGDAAGYGHLLGPTGLTRLQFSCSTRGEGALGFAARLARHLLIRHHDRLLASGSALNPRIHGLVCHRIGLLRGPTAAAAARRCARRRPPSWGGAPGRGCRSSRGRTSGLLGAGGSSGSRNAGSPEASGRSGRHGRARRRSCRDGSRSARTRDGAHRCGRRRRTHRGRRRMHRGPRRSGRGRPATIAAGSVVAAPDDHLHLSYLAPLGLKAVGHAAHTAVEGGNPQAQPQNGHGQHAETHGHQSKW